jgi:hypothetical protein
MFGLWLHTACMEGSEGYLYLNQVSYEVDKPISLTSFFLKTMKRLVDYYIRAGTLKFLPKILMELQHAYQRGRSTEADPDFVQKIGGSLNQKEFDLGVFLDIDGAFGPMDAASMGLL